ncbi:MAG: sugar transferase [Bacteroidota bacterium]
MIKEREPILERLSILFQVFISLLSFYLILEISGDFPDSYITEKKEHLIIGFILIPVWFVLLDIFEMGALARIQKYGLVVKKYFLIVGIGSLILYLLIRFFDYETLTANMLYKFAVLNFLVLTFQKLISRTLLSYFRSKGYNTRMVLAIADESSIPFLEQLVETDHWGYRIWGIITDSREVKRYFGDRFPIYSESESFAKIIDEKVIDEVFYCKQDFETKVIKQLVDDCREIGVSFHIHNEVLSFSGIKPKLFFLNHQFFLSFRNTPENYFALKLKGAMDFFLTIIILILISPVMLLLALLIKLEDGGPVLFKQTRVGRYGRQFTCLKFRTMVVDAEAQKEKLMALNEQDGPVFKIKNDPRITRVGRFLRKTSLDELPQFINVLMGDMSIVGPRPPVPSEVKQYKRSLNRRLSINPGITCTWQVSGRNNIPFEQWMDMDMDYIDNWSLKLDFIIIMKTFRVIFRGTGQ